MAAAVDAGQIPAPLREIAQWLLWRLEEVPGRPKPAKMPVNRQGVKCDPNNPANWLTFDEAQQLAATYPDAFSGVGFNPTGATVDGARVGILDLDEVLDANNTVKPEIWQWFQQRPNVYAEWSPSKRGMRAFLLLPEDHDWLNYGIFNVDTPDGSTALGQVFMADGYCTVTGDAIQGSELSDEPYPERMFMRRASQLDGVEITPRHLHGLAPALDFSHLRGKLLAAANNELPHGERSEMMLPMLTRLAQQCEDEDELADRTWAHLPLQEYWLSKRDGSYERAMALAQRECAIAFRTWVSSAQYQWQQLLKEGPPAAVTPPVASQEEATNVVTRFAPVGSMHYDPPRWLVEGMLTERGTTLIIGPPKSGKSWVAQQAAAALAAGVSEFLGRPVYNHGCVLYLTSEGRPGAHQRLRAMLARAGEPNAPLLAVTPNHRSVRMAATEQFDNQYLDKPAELYHELQAAVASTGQPCVAIVLDTFTGSFVGNQNSAEDTESWLQMMRQMAEWLGAAMVVVHHTNAAGEARGSGNLTAFFDQTLKVTGLPGGQMTIELTHCKDADRDDFGTIEARIEPDMTLHRRTIMDAYETAPEPPEQQPADALTRGAIITGIEVLKYLAREPEKVVGFERLRDVINAEWHRTRMPPAEVTAANWTEYLTGPTRVVMQRLLDKGVLQLGQTARNACGVAYMIDPDDSGVVWVDADSSNGLQQMGVMRWLNS